MSFVTKIKRTGTEKTKFKSVVAREMLLKTFPQIRNFCARSFFDLSSLLTGCTKIVFITTVFWFCPDCSSFGPLSMVINEIKVLIRCEIL